MGGKRIALLMLFASLSCFGQTLTWSDEFNGPDGSAPDPTKWSYRIGTHTTTELEYYTNRPVNSYIQGGNLVIQAFKEEYQGMHYTSAWLQTQYNFSQLFGRFEARIKVPPGAGMWPAFWMLGDDVDTVKWPTCGEIDIMEGIAPTPFKVYGTLHGPDPPLRDYSMQSQYVNPQRLSDDYHVYAVQWTTNEIQFFIDGTLYGTKHLYNMPKGGTWEFNDHPFFMILNLAVGGWGGPPSSTEVWPQQMLVDYVRVYQ